MRSYPSGANSCCTCTVRLHVSIAIHSLSLLSMSLASTNLHLGSPWRTGSRKCRRKDRLEGNLFETLPPYCCMRSRMCCRRELGELLFAMMNATSLKVYCKSLHPDSWHISQPEWPKVFCPRSTWLISTPNCSMNFISSLRPLSICHINAE